MFGAYPHNASYMHMISETSVLNNVPYHVPLPGYLRPSFQPSQSWIQGRGKHGLTEDLIMVAEFSELEGPKPLMTIPKNGGANFDQNGFAVRILAVDCQNSMESFSVSEDAQIVMTDVQTGVFAFVHHLVLYDNTARGFVRPYCIAYITTDQRKLMCFYEELSKQFRKVARYLKYGNKMLFVGDLERHLRDLEYTKNFLLNQVSKIRLRNMEESNLQVKGVRRNAENELYKALHMIQESSKEIRRIISIFKPLLLDQRLEARFKLLEEKAFQKTVLSGQSGPSLQDGWFNDLSGLDDLNVKSDSANDPRGSPLALFKPREYKPILVKTKKAKRFNAPLRGLHELCSWGAKEGMRKLRHVHEYFKRDMTILELEKNETRLLCPNNTSISHGQCITGNFLSDVHLNKYDRAGDMQQSWSVIYNNWGLTGSVDSLISYKSPVSCPPSINGHQESTPSSDLTHESQSALLFRSVPSSPEKEFSFLTTNEYYSASDEENSPKKLMSFNICKNEGLDNVGDVGNRLMADSNDFSQEHRVISSEESCGNEVEVNNPVGRTSSHFETQILEKYPNFSQNSNLTTCSFYSPSDMNFSKELNRINASGTKQEQAQEVKHSAFGKDHFMEYESKADNFELVKAVIMNSNSLDLAGENSNSKVKDESTDRHSEIRSCLNRQDMLIYQGRSNVFNENCCQESLFAGGAASSGDSNGSFDESFSLDLANIDTQSHATSLIKVPDSLSAADSYIKSGIQTHESLLITARNIKPTSSSDYIITTSVDAQQVAKHARNIKSYEKNNVIMDESSHLLQPGEKNIFSELPSSVSAPEDLHTDSKTSELAMTSSWILKNGSIFAKSPASESIFEINFKLAVEDSRKKNSASKLSNLLSQNQHHNSQRTSGLNFSPNGEINHVATNHEVSFRRVRSESDVTTVFATNPAQELHPHFLDVRSDSPSTVDNDLLERFETVDVEDDYVEIQSSHHTGVWKPRCGVYAVGDWINNLTFGRPGHCLYEVLSNYQKMEHVIFSLLCGRSVLVVGPAKLEQEVVKLVNALAVFVPGVGSRKGQAVIEWTSQCLKITDLTKLKLVGMCRPERRSADSFIPSAIKRACTVLDIEKRTISAPPYQGQFIATLMSKKKAFKSDIQLLCFIEWWLMDILAKVFLFFHIFCLASAGSVLYSHSPKDQRDAYCATVSTIMNRLGVKDHDCEIIEHLAELVKMSELEPHVWIDIDSGSVVHPLALHHKICEKFRC